MNVFSVNPLIGISDIKFGNKPDEVREKLNSPYVSFKRSEESVYPCDFFESIAAFAYYDAMGGLEAMEFASPALVLLDGADLLKMPASRVRDSLLAKDKNLEVELDGVTSYEIGIGMYAPDLADEPGNPPEGVIVFAKNYYD